MTKKSVAVKRKEGITAEEEGKEASVSSFSTGFSNAIASKKLKFSSDNKNEKSPY